MKVIKPFPPIATLLMLGMLGSVPAVAQVTPCTADDLGAVPIRYNVDFEVDIQAIFSVACSGCHIGGMSGGLSLAPGNAFANLVNVPANNVNAGIARVTPGNSEASFLFKKTNCTNLNDIASTPFGRRMPRNGPPYLSVQDQAAILDWIEQGAQALANPELIFGSGFGARDN